MECQSANSQWLASCNESKWVVLGFWKWWISFETPYSNSFNFYLVWLYPKTLHSFYISKFFISFIFFSVAEHIPTFVGQPYCIWFFHFPPLSHHFTPWDNHNWISPLIMDFPVGKRIILAVVVMHNWLEVPLYTAAEEDLRLKDGLYPILPATLEGRMQPRSPSKLQQRRTWG